MAFVKDLLAAKGSSVQSIGADATVLDAAILMNDHKIGSLVVMEAGQIRGIFTERDILRRVVALSLDPRTTRVHDVMTADVVCCVPESTVEELRGVMKNRRIRHIPVVDDSRRLCGLVSIGDINSHESTNQERTIHLLQAYIQGTA